MYSLIYLQGKRWTPIIQNAPYPVCVNERKKYERQRGYVKLHIVKSSTDLNTHHWQ